MDSSSGVLFGPLFTDFDLLGLGSPEVGLWTGVELISISKAFFFGVSWFKALSITSPKICRLSLFSGGSVGMVPPGDLNFDFSKDDWLSFAQLSID